MALAFGPWAAAAANSAALGRRRRDNGADGARLRWTLVVLAGQSWGRTNHGYDGLWCMIVMHDYDYDYDYDYHGSSTY